MWFWKEIGIEVDSGKIRQLLEENLSFKLVEETENPFSSEFPHLKRGEDYHVTVMKDGGAVRMVFAADDEVLWRFLAVVLLMEFPDAGVLIFEGNGVTGVGEWWASEKGANNLIHVKGESRVGLFNQDLSAAFSKRTGVPHVGVKKVGTCHRLYRAPSPKSFPALGFLEPSGSED